MKKKPVDRQNKRKYCEYEQREKDCPDYEKSTHCNLCKWGMYEGTCVCFKANQCTG